MPTFSSPGRGNLGRAETFGHLRQAGSLDDIGVPGKHVLDHGGLDRVDTHTAGSTRALGIEEITVRCPCPRQKLAAAELGLAPSAHTFSDQSAFVLSHSAAHL
jgi:hypothetical protein